MWLWAGHPPTSGYFPVRVNVTAADAMPRSPPLPGHKCLAAFPHKGQLVFPFHPVRLQGRPLLPVKQGFRPISLIYSRHIQIMNTQCAAIGCLSLSVGFSTLCTQHRKALTRHGHPGQSPVTVHELRPYLNKVAARQQANPSSPAWPILTDRWAVIIKHAQKTLAAYEGGRACNRYAILTAQQVRTLADSVAPTAVMQTALAMYLLAEDRPSRFVSDAGFGFQLVRRVRGLTTTNAGSYWDPKTRKTKRVYKDLPPRVVEVLAGQLKATFGAAGIQLVAFERQQMAAADVERRKLSAALEALK